MKKEFDYFLDAFKTCYQIDKWPEISYNEMSPGDINIKPCVPHNIFKNKITISVESIIWKEWKNQKIPFLFDLADNAILTYTDSKAYINFDIVASGFYLLSGYQELDKSKCDYLGRFKYSESIQNLLGIAMVPVVNYYFDILKTAIEKVTKKKLTSRISLSNPFTVCLTHDIDNCENGWLEGSAWALKRKKIIDPIKLLYLKFLKRKDVWFNFDYIIEIEKRYGATSSFYFLCRKGKSLGKPNADYDIANKKFLTIFDRIKKAGSEIGIHGSFGTHNNSRSLLSDMAALGQPVKGGRFHFLEFEVDKTPGILEECELKYDSSLGFAEHVGFRNSFCYPFRLYDFQNDRPSNVWEIPLIVMDSTFYSKHYMGLTPEKSLAIIDNLIDEVKKFNGIFTILWHNTFFSDYKYNGWKAVYLYTLKTAKEQNALLTSAYGIVSKLKNADD